MKGQELTQLKIVENDIKDVKVVNGDDGRHSDSGGSEHKVYDLDHLAKKNIWHIVVNHMMTLDERL